MIVQGLNNNRYLVNNPIWVDITGAGAKVQLNFTSLAEELANYNVFTYYTFGGGTQIDVSEIVKALFPEPNHPTGLINGQVVPGNAINQTLTFTSGSSSSSFPKTFIRGGNDTMSTNQFLQANSVLKESEKIPVWQGYPSAKYQLNSNNQVVFYNILANAEIDRRKVVTCEPVFLRFRNSRGGYSFWLFEEWEMSEKTKQTERIDRRGNPLDLGLDTEWELSTKTRVEREYNATLSALLKSPEVYAYNLGDVLNSRGSGDAGSKITAQWTRIYNNGGSMKWNPYEQMNEYSFKFDLLFKNKTTLTW